MSERNLVWRVSVAGRAEFQGALRGIMDEVRKGADAQLAMDRTVAASRIRAAKSAAQAVTKIEDELTKHILAQMEARSKAAEASARRTKTATGSAAVGGASGAGSLAVLSNASTREFERAEREKTRILEREHSARARSEEQSMRQAHRDEERRLRDRAFDQKRLYRGVATGFVEGGLGAFQMVGGAVARGVRGIASATGLNGAYDLQDIISEQLAGQKMMTSVAIEARQAGQGFGGFDRQAAMKKVREAALATGTSQKDLFEAIDVYSEKGSGKTAIDNLDRIAGQGLLFGGASVVSKLRAQLGLSSSIAGKELSEDEKDSILAVMNATGKTGVFRASDMAKESESLFSQFAASGMDFKSGMSRYLGFANLARSSVGRGAMARTAINSMQSALATKEGKLNAMGIKTRFTNEEGIESKRDFIDVTLDLIEKTNGNAGLLNKIIPASRGGKAIENLVAKYNSAGKGKKGRAAMEALLAGDPSLKNATVADMQKDIDFAKDDPAQKMAMQREKLRQKIADAIMPAVEKLAQHLPMLVDKIIGAIEFLEKHPILGSMGLVGAYAMKGAAGPLAAHGIGAAARFLAEGAVNTVPRLLGMGGAAAALGAGGAGAGAGAIGAGGAAGSAGAAIASTSAAQVMGAAIGQVIGPILAAAVAGYLIANVASDAQNKTGSFDTRTDAIKGGEGVDAAQSALARKLGKELDNVDEDPGERELLADMMGWGKADPRLDKMIEKKNKNFADASGVAGLGDVNKSLIAKMLGKDADETSRYGYESFAPGKDADETSRYGYESFAGGGGGGQTPLQKIVTQNDATTGEGLIKQSVDLSAKTEQLVKSLDGAAKSAQNLDNVLSKLGGNQSALKPPPGK